MISAEKKPPDAMLFLQKQIVQPFSNYRILAKASRPIITENITSNRTDVICRWRYVSFL